MDHDGGRTPGDGRPRRPGHQRLHGRPLHRAQALGPAADGNPDRDRSAEPEKEIGPILPGGHTISDTRRLIMYARREPDDRRMVFGGDRLSQAVRWRQGRFSIGCSPRCRARSFRRFGPHALALPLERPDRIDRRSPATPPRAGTRVCSPASATTGAASPCRWSWDGFWRSVPWVQIRQEPAVSGFADPPDRLARHTASSEPRIAMVVHALAGQSGASLTPGRLLTFHCPRRSNSGANGCLTNCLSVAFPTSDSGHAMLMQKSSLLAIPSPSVHETLPNQPQNRERLQS